MKESTVTSGSGGANLLDRTSQKGKKKKQTVSSMELRALLKAQDFKCALTGRDLTPDVATCDHIVPIAKGGSNTIDNIQIVHKDANDAKRVMSQDEFIRLCMDVALWHSSKPAKPQA